jgi:AcrR family transcriptional regulator
MTHDSVEKLLQAVNDTPPSRPVSLPETASETPIMEIVLRDQGHAGFSTRRVATEAAIALGNLTYHFPTKSMLLRALIDRLMKKYLDAFVDVLETPGQGLETLVRWLLVEAASEEATWLFRELWAMARHDETVSDAIEKFYDDLMDKISTKLEHNHPTTNRDDIRTLVQFVAIISEGSAVLYGTRRNKSDYIYDVYEKTLKVMKSLCEFRE